MADNATRTARGRHATIAARIRRRSQIDNNDPDSATNEEILHEKQTMSRVRLRRLKIVSAFPGSGLPSRKKIFSAIQGESDYKLFSISVPGKTIPCAKVYNPALLEKDSHIWNKLANVERFELEDPEGLLSTIPRHYATNMEQLESFSFVWGQVKSLPSELLRGGLKTLVLKQNQLNTLSGIEKAVDLTILDVGSNLLTELPKTFGQLQNLTSLSISGNAIRQLPENFGALNQLRVLDCSCNRLTSLPESIGHLIELVSVDVGNNNLTSLPDGISSLPKLEDLNARVNRLTSLPAWFGQLLRLSSLNLRKNRFADIPRQLAHISSLHTLNMKDNLIASVPQAIPSLRTAILDSNQLTEIPDGLLQCSNLQLLSLENNKITSIPGGITRLKTLHALHLSENDIEEVPEHIGGLTHLRHLVLRRTLIKTLPDAILTMAELMKVDVTDCPQLKGYIRLAHNEGGLKKIREEMIQEKRRTTMFFDPPGPVQTENAELPVSGSSDDGSTEEPSLRVGQPLIPCQRSTVMYGHFSDELPAIQETDSLDPETQNNEAGSIPGQESVASTTAEDSQGIDSQTSVDYQSDVANQTDVANQVGTAPTKKPKPPTLPKHPDLRRISHSTVGQLNSNAYTPATQSEKGC